MITNVEAITVFNGRTDPEQRRTKYVPTVIRGVSYAEAKGSSVTNSGVWSSDVQYKIRIPAGAEVRAGRKYLERLRYAALPDGEAEKYWTLGKKDLIIEGDHSGIGTGLFEDMIDAYAKEHGLDVIRITEYADNTSGGSPYMRHWRVGGK